MEQYAALLRSIAAYAGLSPVKVLASGADVRDIYRITVQYGRMRAANTIITLFHMSGHSVSVESVYHGYFDNKPIIRSVNYDTFHDFAVQLRKLPFDKLGDQPDMRYQDVDLWLVERASAGFYKSVMFSPQNAQGSYADLHQIISTFLPDSLREIK